MINLRCIGIRGAAFVSTTMGNSSLSVEQALGSFNFKLTTVDDITYFKASLDLHRFAILRHIRGYRAPYRYTDPITVEVYETINNLLCKMWMREYESVTDFLSLVHRGIPWNQPSCEAVGCKNPPVADSNKCEKHIL